MKSEGWLRSVEAEKEPWETWRQFLPFVPLCYTQDFSDDEKRRVRTEGLPDKAAIFSYPWLSKEQYQLAIPIPYTVSSNPSFPFHKDDIVKVSMQGKTLVIKILADDKTEEKEH